jgi:hypothetical protein
MYLYNTLILLRVIFNTEDRKSILPHVLVLITFNTLYYRTFLHMNADLNETHNSYGSNAFYGTYMIITVTIIIV